VAADGHERPLTTKQVKELRNARALWRGCDSPEPLPFPSDEREYLTQFENHLRKALKCLGRMHPRTRDRLAQFFPDPEMRGLNGMGNQLLDFAAAASEAKAHRHGSFVLKDRFGTEDYLIIGLLADFYFEATGKKATVHWDYDTGELKGDFLDLVPKAWEQAFDGEEAPSPDRVRDALHHSSAGTCRW
jgi:hypothetical protein